MNNRDSRTLFALKERYDLLREENKKLEQQLETAGVAERHLEARLYDVEGEMAALKEDDRTWFELKKANGRLTVERNEMRRWCDQYLKEREVAEAAYEKVCYRVKFGRKRYADPFDASQCYQPLPEGDDELYVEVEDVTDENNRSRLDGRAYDAKVLVARVTRQAILKACVDKVDGEHGLPRLESRATGLVKAARGGK